MSSELSRRQFYARAQGLLVDVERLRREHDKEWCRAGVLEDNCKALAVEVERLQKSLREVAGVVECDLRELTRDLVNAASGLKNGAHPNDIYEYCDKIDAVIGAALEAS